MSRTTDDVRTHVPRDRRDRAHLPVDLMEELTALADRAEAARQLEAESKAFLEEVKEVTVRTCHAMRRFGQVLC